jgi:D-3-phosphoglycerate dehydrogenase
VLAPHIGYGTIETLTGFYRQSIENVLAWLDGKPIHLMDVSAMSGKPTATAKG